MYFIYILKCPITDQIRYVGQTSQKLEKRFSNHIWESRRKKKKYSHKENWIRKLSRMGLEPKIEKIENIEMDLDFVIEREKFWISKFKKSGIELLNATDGGEYSSNNVTVKFDMSGEKNPMFGKKHRDTTKKKMSEKKIGLYDGVNNPRAKPIYQYDDKVTFIKKWECAKECADFYNISRGNISSAAKYNSSLENMDKYMVRYGFIFSFTKF